MVAVAAPASRHHAPPPLSHGRRTDDNPMGDVAALLSDVKTAHVDRRYSVFLSFFVSFDDRTRWEQAGQNASAERWQVASYSTSGRHTVRLSCETRLSAERLEELRGVVQAFAEHHGGVWESMAVEGAQRESRWTRIADKYVPAKTANKHDRPAPVEPQPELVAGIPRQRSATRRAGRRSA